MKIEIIEFGNGYMIDVDGKPYDFVKKSNFARVAHQVKRYIYRTLSQQ